MMRAVLVVVTLLLFLPMSAVSMPAGVGSSGDSGCSCHGGVSSAVTVNLSIDGLPAAYTAGQAYVLNVTLSTTSDDHVNRSSPNNGDYRGFRMIGAGEFALHQNATGVQLMDNGRDDDGWGQGQFNRLGIRHGRAQQHRGRHVHRLRHARERWRWAWWRCLGHFKRCHPRC